jgi:hypothetical protein
MGEYYNPPMIDHPAVTREYFAEDVFRLQIGGLSPAFTDSAKIQEGNEQQKRKEALRKEALSPYLRLRIQRLIREKQDSPLPGLDIKWQKYIGNRLEDLILDRIWGLSPEPQMGLVLTEPASISAFQCGQVRINVSRNVPKGDNIESEAVNGLVREFATCTAYFNNAKIAYKNRHPKATKRTARYQNLANKAWQYANIYQERANMKNIDLDIWFLDQHNFQMHLIDDQYRKFFLLKKRYEETCMSIVMQPLKRWQQWLVQQPRDDVTAYEWDEEQ